MGKKRKGQISALLIGLAFITFLLYIFIFHFDWVAGMQLRAWNNLLDDEERSTIVLSPVAIITPILLALSLIIALVFKKKVFLIVAVIIAIPTIIVFFAFIMPFFIMTLIVAIELAIITLPPYICYCIFKG